MSHFLEKYYPFVPVSIQNLGLSAYGYFWRERRFGGIFKRELLEFKNRESLSSEGWHDYQTAELRKFLISALSQVPYYKNKFTAAGLSIDTFKRFELEDLTKLPFLEKEELRKYGTTDLLAQNRSSGDFFASSGSTGTPTEIYFSKQMHQRWSAGFEARIRHWAGVNNTMSRGMIGGRRVVPIGHGKPPYFRYNYFEKQVYFSAYHISEKTAGNYAAGIKKYGIEYMTGYAASNYFLARFFEELKLDVPPLKAVITSSEKLTTEMRALLEKTYQCKSFDSYSGVEACGLISECEFGSLHVNPDMGILEFINQNGEYAKPGELAEIVCTGILNYDQPLIRYRIGDTAILSDRKCQCGRELTVVEEIIGRVEDIVIGKDGREMVRFHGIFIELPNIKEAQVVQENFTDFTINISAHDKLTLKEMDAIERRMISQLGDVKIKINQLPQIPRGSNGKFKPVISKVKRARSLVGLPNPKP